LKKKNFPKKRKKKEKRKNLEKKRKRKTLWITVIIHRVFVCGGTVNPPHGLVY
jgi:hypothetical protein